MTHRSIKLIDLTLSFPHKICFENFSAKIHFGQRIGIVGANGSGKSSLLKMLMSIDETTLRFGYVEQTIDRFDKLSGGQRFNQALTEALSLRPNILCLDEPTNHLDQKNRHSLLKMLERFDGTLIVATHDVQLLDKCVNQIWCVGDGRVRVFSGSYTQMQEVQRNHLEGLDEKKRHLKKEKIAAHEKLMREQKRAKKKREYGEKKYDGDKLALRGAQGKGELTANKNRKEIAVWKNDSVTQLANLRIPEVLTPKFILKPKNISSHKPVLSIREGKCGYDKEILNNIDIDLFEGQKLWISGSNGSGKTTLLKAICNDKSLWRAGHWQISELNEIGVLDQHYRTLNEDKCAIEVIQGKRPELTHAEIRNHLNAFLLRKNEEVSLPVKLLSGGEKARLCLAEIAAKMPRLLILDEITNNIDIQTREHVVQVLREYSGALIVVSHDETFVEEIGASKNELKMESLSEGLVSK